MENNGLPYLSPNLHIIFRFAVPNTPNVHIILRFAMPKHISRSDTALLNTFQDHSGGIDEEDDFKGVEQRKEPAAIAALQRHYQV